MYHNEQCVNLTFGIVIYCRVLQYVNKKTAACRQLLRYDYYMLKFIDTKQLDLYTEQNEATC
jgi:hypothetical protein